MTPQLPKDEAKLVDQWTPERPPVTSEPDERADAPAGVVASPETPAEAAPEASGRKLRGAVPSAETGWLARGAGGLVVRTLQAVGNSQEEAWVPWADFDLEVVGTAINSDGTRSWVGNIRKGNRVHQVEFVPKVLADQRALESLLASFGATVGAPNEGNPKMPWRTRLIRFLEATSPGEFAVVRHLGWNEGAGGFVTFEGVLTATERLSFQRAGVMPKSGLSRISPDWSYGFRSATDADEAKRVLAEVLTFQDETVAAVAGAWWAACLLKPQTVPYVSVFPNLAVEAVSGSGKTKGFFPLLLALSGYTGKPLVPTVAAFKRMAAVHHSGIVWVDDLNDPKALFELFRAMTGDGSTAHVGEDRESVEDNELVAPALLSGEALGLATQKAMVDRFVTLRPGPVSERRSLRDPSRPQWDDVLALRQQHPDLSQFAGWLVQDALGHAEGYVSRLRGAPRLAPGRAGDKLSVLLAGAWLLDRLAGRPEGDEWAERLVRSWARGEAADVLANENALTLQVLPWAIRAFGSIRRGELVTEGRWRGTPPPVVIERDGDEDMLDGETRVLVNTALLADAWESYQNHRIDERTESGEALRQQMGQVSVGKREFVRYGGGLRFSYSRLAEAYVPGVIARAEGDR